MANFAKSKNKFKYVYLLTPQGIAEKVALTSRFLKRRMEEYEALKVEIEALKTEVGDDKSGQKVQKHDQRSTHHSLRWLRYSHPGRITLHRYR